MADIGTDVLVLGGGPAGCWAALTAAAAGLTVTLADKGDCGWSGPSAVPSARTTLWTADPQRTREEEVAYCHAAGGYLGDPEWMDRVLDETTRRMAQLGDWGYRFSSTARQQGVQPRLNGPGYLRLLRARLGSAGVRVLDQHAALRLLRDRAGIVSGAEGIAAGAGFRPWSLRARAVVVATGGCVFGSGVPGAAGNTGDGHLMAAELGAELSGMEFSCAYGLGWAAGVGGAPAPSVLHFATFYDAQGNSLGTGPAAEAGVLAALARGQHVSASPASALAARAHGVRAVMQGTVRGTGGLHLTGFDCATSVPGLFAAGDVATRESISGASSGASGQRGSWAIASGCWAGAGAVRFAKARNGVGVALVRPGAGLGPAAGVSPDAIVGLVQEHMLPLRRSFLRSQGSLRNSVAELDGVWPGAMFGLGGCGRELIRAREAAALLAVARWTTHSALTRTESRGMHRRTDHPQNHHSWQRRLASGGLAEVWVRAG